MITAIAAPDSSDLKQLFFTAVREYVASPSSETYGTASDALWAVLNSFNKGPKTLALHAADPDAPARDHAQLMFSYIAAAKGI